MIIMPPVDFSAALAPFGLAASAFVLVGCAAIVAAATSRRVDGHTVPSGATADHVDPHRQAA